MGSCGTLPKSHVAAVLIVLISHMLTGSMANFSKDFSVSWSPDHAHISPDGNTIALSLDQSSGCAFASKQTYLFGQIDMSIKLVPGNSAGTVTTYYLHSLTDVSHDEVDFEFLGNVSGQPYVLQTNVFNRGTGGREQRVYLWFDPTADFHTYSVLWTQQRVLMLVDGTAIRSFPNLEAKGVPYLNNQSMGVFASIWDGDSWATRGGLDKIDWSAAPFTATYASFKADACIWTADSSASAQCPTSQWWTDSAYQNLTASQQQSIRRVQQKYMVYNYCTDSARYPSPPLECTTTS